MSDTTGVHLNTKAEKTHTYDVIVIGSGISGSWAAKEFCEKGYKTLMLERGRMVKHIVDYPTAAMDPWDFPHKGALTPAEREEHYIQSRSGFVGEGAKHFFANDKDNPYVETKRFDWIRGHQVGGRSLTWGKHCYRWSDLDFEANAKDGHGVDWPIRYKDIAPWYSYVEKYIGVSGEKLGLSQLPDGEFLPPMELTAAEKYLKEGIHKNFTDRTLTIGRVAHLTVPHNGRGQCQSRNRCNRGCPFGAYFSSNAVTIPAAEKTGNLTIVPHAIVNSVIYDATKEKATGVRVIDENTHNITEYYAKVIFCNASAMSTLHILLNSTSNRFPNGLGNDSGVLGHYIMDHHYRVGAGGNLPGHEDRTYTGRRPNGPYIPRYWNVNEKSVNKNFVRGFGYQGDSFRQGWGRGKDANGFGGDFKDSLSGPGEWQIGLIGFGEVLPDIKNKVSISSEKKDKWGQPVLAFDCDLGENEKAMRKQMASDAAEMLEKAGFKNVSPFEANSNMGLAIHEMGGARMGRDPKTSVLNGFNQMHAVKNVFVTDGACMASSATQNPSITYMALTARAVDYAVSEMKKQNL